MLPEHPAVEVHGGEVPAAELGVDGLAIGDRRGVAARGERTVARIGQRPEGSLPELVTLEVVGEEGVLSGRG